MKLRYVLAVIFCLGFNPLMSAEEVIVDYSYNGNHNTDFSSISVSLKIENVIDKIAHEKDCDAFRRVCKNMTEFYFDV